MTSETRTLIEAKDILGVEIECSNCRMTIFYPTAVKEIIKIAHYCSNCNHRLFDEATTPNFGIPTHPGIETIQTIASHLRTLTRPDRTDIHAQIRFRVNVEPRAAK